MSVTYINGAATTPVSGTSISATVPSGGASGDLMIAILGHSDNNPVADINSVPSGWTQWIGKTLMGVQATSPPQFYIYYKVHSGAEPGSYSWGWSLTGGLTAHTLIFRGQDGGTAWQGNTANSSQTGTGTDAISPAVTVANNGSQIIRIGWTDAGVGQVPPTGVPSGVSNALESETTAGGNGMSLMTGTEASDAASAPSRTWTLSGADERSGFSAVIRPLAGPTISDIGDEDFDDNETGITITGSGFGASDTGSADVELGDNATYASANLISLSRSGWSATSITGVVMDLGTQSPGGKWIFVTDSTGQVSAGYPVTVHREQAWVMSASVSIAVSGENTTARLTAPAGKSSGTDFVAGRIQDDENPADAVDITSVDYTEMAWSIEAKPAARTVSYSFRVTANGTPLDTYTVTPTTTVTAGATFNDSVAETTAPSTSESVTAALGVADAESVAATSAEAVTAAMGVVQAESVAPSTSESVTAALTVADAESNAIVDAQSVTAAYALSVADGNVALDSQDASVLLGGSAAESASVADAQSTIAVMLASVSETATVSDAQDVTAGMVVSVSEGGGLRLTGENPDTNFDDSVSQMFDGDYAGETFVAAVDGLLTQMRFYLTNQALDGTFRAVLYEADAGTVGVDGRPSGSPGTPLAVSDNVSYTEIPNFPTYGWVTFPFDGTVMVRAGKAYSAMVNNVSGSSTTRIGGEFPNPSHPGNMVYGFGGAWSTFDTADTMFEVTVDGGASASDIESAALVAGASAAEATAIADASDAVQTQSDAVAESVAAADSQDGETLGSFSGTVAESSSVADAVDATAAMSVSVDEATAGIIYKNTTSQDNAYALYNGFTTRAGQTFQGVAGAKLLAVTFTMSKLGSPPGTMVAELWETTGTVGFSATPNTGVGVLATSGTIVASSIGTSPGDVTFTFPTPYTLEAKDYIVTVTYNDAGSNASNRVTLHYRGISSDPNNNSASFFASWSGTPADVTPVTMIASGVGPNDAQSVTMVADKATAESNAIADSSTVTAVSGVDVAEVDAASDAQTVVVSFPDAVADSAGVADAQDADQTGQASGTVSESSSIVDDQGVTAVLLVDDSESVTASDAPVGGLVNTSDTSESVAASDSETGLLVLTSQAAEAAAISDANAVTASEGAAVAESTPADASQNASMVAVAARTESVAVSEAQAVLRVITDVVADTLVISDVAAALLIVLASVFEDATISDDNTPTVVNGVLVDEVMSVVDWQEWSAIFTFVPSVERMVLLSPRHRYLVTVALNRLIALRATHRTIVR